AGDSLLSPAGVDAGPRPAQPRSAHARLSRGDGRGGAAPRRGGVPRQGRTDVGGDVSRRVSAGRRAGGARRPRVPLAVLGAGVAVSSEPRRVVIFGATSGIAQAVAREYARRGARLVLVARAPERLAAVAADLEVRGGTVVRRVADLTEGRGHPTLGDASAGALGGIDVAPVAHAVLAPHAHAGKG